jgi:hypothetical protein
LQIPDASAGPAALSTITQLGTISLGDDLHRTDRALWQEILTGWQYNQPAKGGSSPSILFSGLLLSASSSGFGVPDPATWLISACSPLTAERSYLVITGSTPALQGAWVFVQREGQLLLYFRY